jgi:hypothetical protein
VAAGPRPLKTQEATLLRWCAESLPEPDRTNFKEQIAAACVEREERGHVDFGIPSSIAPVTSAAAINLWYDDLDGSRVDFIVSFVAGRLSWIDRYRIAGGDPEVVMPDVDRVRLYES